ncbi:hypothetical protein ACTFIY_002504 [Dictyostelium cf. discoideum]
MTKILNITFLIIYFTITIIKGTPLYNCNKLNCSSMNTNCKIFGCSPMFGCFETSKCPQSNVNICHTNHCDENTGSCYQIADTCNGNNNTIDSCGPYGCVNTPVNPPEPTQSCEQKCNDNNPCTVDFCDFRGDCYHYDTSCSDYIACTLDTCGEKGCEYRPMNCDDNNPCTADFCAMLYGCYHEPIECSVKVPCSTDSQCNRNNFCETYSCDLSSNTCDYYARDCGGNPCINNGCRTGTITN